MTLRGNRLCLLTVVILFIAIAARWIWIFRHGLALDIDEAGYVSFAIIDYYGLLYGGLHGWIAAIEMPSIQAPLTTALASLVFFVIGPHVTAAFVVPVAAGAGCILAAFMLGRSIGSGWTALVAALLTASCPAIITYSREFHFAMPATLATSVALLAILRSGHFRHLGWSLAFGICLGVMPLARTMTIAFMPGVIAAAFVAVVVDPAQRGRALAMFAASLVLAALVAASWLWPNGLLVAHYLLNFGYGHRALEFGAKTSKFGPDAWLAMGRAFGREVYLPHLLVILAGIIALLAVTLREAARLGIGRAARLILQSPALPLVIFTTEALLALTTSGNKGGGFFAPIIPALMALTAWGFQRLRQFRWTRQALSLLVGLVVVAGIVPSIDLHTPFARETVLTLPGLGATTLTDGRGNIQRAEAFVGYGAPGDVDPIDRASSRAWINLSVSTAAILTQQFGRHATVAFAFRNGLYNVNTINLQELLHERTAFSEIQIEPAVTGESVAGYLDWLRTSVASACALLTSDRLGGDFAPSINRDMMAEAARQGGFLPLRHWPLPDGQIVTLWTHRVAPPDCRP